MFSEFQPVVLLRDISREEQAGFDDLDFKCGDVGVLVDLLGGKGGVAVEFNLGKAHTADVLFITESDIRSIGPSEIWHVRPLNPDQRDTTPAEWEQGFSNTLERSSEVVLKRDFKSMGLKRGDLGRLTDWDAGAGTIQFQAAVGQEWNGPLLTVRPENVRFRERDEIAVVRKLRAVFPVSGDASSGTPCT